MVWELEHLLEVSITYSVSLLGVLDHMVEIGFRDNPAKTQVRPAPQGRKPADKEAIHILLQHLRATQPLQFLE